MIREGFEPSRFNPTSSSSFVVGDDDDEPGNIGKMHEDSEEAQHWHESENRGGGGEPAMKSNRVYGSLGDEHIWNSEG